VPQQNPAEPKKINGQKAEKGAAKAPRPGTDLHGSVLPAFPKGQEMRTRKSTMISESAKLYSKRPAVNRARIEAAPAARGGKPARPGSLRKRAGRRTPGHENQPGEEGGDPPLGGDLDEVVVKMDVLTGRLGQAVLGVLENHVHRVRAGAVEGIFLDDPPAGLEVFDPERIAVIVQAEDAQGAALHGLGTEGPGKG